MNPAAFLKALRAFLPPVIAVYQSPPGNHAQSTGERWAICHYHEFPHYICGKVEQLDADGCVYLKGFPGQIHKPVTFMFGQRGADFHAYLTAASTAYQAILAGYAAGMHDELAKGLKPFNVPARNVPSGIRYAHAGDVFHKEVSKILLGEAPSFSYGHKETGKPLWTGSR